MRISSKNLENLEGRDQLAYKIYESRLNDHGLGRLKIAGKQDRFTDYILADAILSCKPFYIDGKEVVICHQ